MSYTRSDVSKIFYTILLFFISTFSGYVYAQVSPAQVPLKPTAIPQFVDPLPHFAGLRVDAKFNGSSTGGDLIIQAVPNQQIAVSTGTKLAAGKVTANSQIGLANVWAYRISNDNGQSFTPPLWPAFTIEAMRGVPLRVKHQNMLGGQSYANVNLVADQTIHWADPFMSMGGMSPYAGEPPLVTHLHGGEVESENDGGPYAWSTPENSQQTNPPLRGYSFNEIYNYPNSQEAATIWFHDHALGLTRLNVYAGLAGFYFLRDPNENSLQLPGFSGDGLVQEVDRATGLPTARAPYMPEIEIAIQDRMFDTNGGLYYPNLPTNPMVHPFWTPEFIGDVITVNGKTWPYLSVAPRKYRFRILNGSNARFYDLAIIKGPAIVQIGTDGGFLDAPVPIAGRLLLAPGERADVIIDFTAFAGKTLILDNTAKAPYPAGAPPSGTTVGRIMQFVVNGKMVSPDVSVIPATLKSNVKLVNFAAVPPAPAYPPDKTRELTLNEVMGMGGPLEILVNNTKFSGLSLGSTIRTDFTAVKTGMCGDPKMDITYYSETMTEGETEVWKIINLTADAHPIHLHLVQFQLLSRQTFNLKGYNAIYNAAFPGGAYLGGYGPPMDYNFYAAAPNIPASGAYYGGNPDVTPFLTGAPRPANPNERGWKDTFIMYPGEVTTVVVRLAPTDKAAGLPKDQLMFPFDPSTGLGYVWHCHIIDHEDNEMMRPYNVAPNPSRNSIIAKGTAGKLIADAQLPGSFELGQNYPNPFNPTTTIRFALPADTHVELKVYNSIGREVTTLINQQVPAGYHTVRLDASGLASGVYLYRIQAGSYVKTQKMILAK